MVVRRKRVSAWFFKSFINSHSGQAVEEIIKRLQLVIYELHIRGQGKGDNRIRYHRPNCFERFCIEFICKRIQNARGVASRCSSSDIRDIAKP